MHHELEGNPLAENTPKTGTEEQAAQQSEIVLKDENANAAYSNFARVTATPEEVLADCRLNHSPILAGNQEIHFTAALIMNFYTAKVMCSALRMTPQRHEQACGSIDLRVSRRAQIPQTGIKPQ